MIIKTRAEEEFLGWLEQCAQALRKGGGRDGAYVPASLDAEAYGPSILDFDPGDAPGAAAQGMERKF